MGLLSADRARLIAHGRVHLRSANGTSPARCFTRVCVCLLQTCIVQVVRVDSMSTQRRVLFA